MARIVISLDGKIIKRWKLDKEVTTLGRAPVNDIEIDDPFISSEHLTITNTTSGPVLADLGSTNRTIVNGETISTHLLQDDDIIQLGKFEIKYFGDNKSRGMVQPSSPVDQADEASLGSVTKADLAPRAHIIQPTVGARAGSGIGSVMPVNRLIRNMLFALLGMIGIVVGLRSCVGDRSAKKPSVERKANEIEKKKRPQEQSIDRKVVIAAENLEDRNIQFAKVALHTVLDISDPESTQVSDVKIIDTHGNNLVCGRFNTKNRFGGYVGWKYFVLDLNKGPSDNFQMADDISGYIPLPCQ